AISIRVVVKLIHHHPLKIGPPTFTQSQVAENLRRTANDRCLVVDSGVARHHADVLRTEYTTQLEKLFTHQGLDGRRVKSSLTIGDGSKAGSRRYQGLA